MSEITKFIPAIKAALGNDQKYFSFNEGEIFDQCDDFISFTVAIEPKKDLLIEDGKVVGQKQFIEFCFHLPEAVLSLVINEDNEVSLNKENIYSYLYWCEATEAV